MTEPTPPPCDRRTVDAEHLKLLSIFHIVVAALALFGVGFLALHYLFMTTFILNPDRWQGAKHAAPPPREFVAILQWFYGAFGLFLLSGCVANLCSGLFLRARKHRMFSLVVAGIDCLQIPFGTVLGVFTILVLIRDSVRKLYEPGAGP